MADGKPSRPLAGAPRRCPACGARILLPEPGGLSVRNATLRLSAQTGRAVAKCPRCRGWVEVPLRSGD